MKGRGNVKTTSKIWAATLLLVAAACQPVSVPTIPSPSPSAAPSPVPTPTPSMAPTPSPSMVPTPTPTPSVDIASGVTTVKIKGTVNNDDGAPLVNVQVSARR